MIDHERSFVSVRERVVDGVTADVTCGFGGPDPGPVAVALGGVAVGH